MIILCKRNKCKHNANLNLHLRGPATSAVHVRGKLAVLDLALAIVHTVIDWLWRLLHTVVPHSVMLRYIQGICMTCIQIKKILWADYTFIDSSITLWKSLIQRNQFIAKLSQVTLQCHWKNGVRNGTNSLCWNYLVIGTGMKTINKPRGTVNHTCPHHISSNIKNDTCKVSSRETNTSLEHERKGRV